MMKIKFFVSCAIVVILFSFLFCSCSSCALLYANDINEIYYNGNKYVHDFDSNWVIEDDRFTTETIQQGDYQLKANIYEKDKNKQFLFCVDNSQLYKKEGTNYPQNSVYTIKGLNVSFYNKPQITDRKLIEEFVNIISKQPEHNIGEIKDSYCTIRISYKDSPVVNYFGNINIDKDNNYWLDHSNYTETEDDLIITEEYYRIDSDSILLEYMGVN